MKKTRNSLPIRSVLAISIVLIACERESLNEEQISDKAAQVYIDYNLGTSQTCFTNEEEPIDPSDYDGSVILGEEKKIPQTIENMQSAWEKLQERELYLGMENPVKVNRLYVRFLPESKAQLLELSRYDESLDLFDFPLHYDFEPTTEANDGYRDRTLPLEAPNPMYTVVDHDYIFPPTIDHEVLMELYMPDEDPSIDRYLASDLETMAENLTTDFKGELDRTSKKWRPEGRIRVIDHAAGEPTDGQAVPIAGVQVLARRGLKWSWGITDEQGEFRVKKDFKNSVEYSVRWSNHEWYIIKGSGVTRAWYFGPNKKSDWDAIINGSIQSFYAQIHRAAYHSFYGENYGITRPMHNKPGNDRIWIRAYKKATKNEKVAYFNDQAPHAVIIYARKKDGDWLFGDNFDKNHDLLYAIIIHEFGHASHRNLAYIKDDLKWTDTDGFVIESWALGIETELGKTIYPNRFQDILNVVSCYNKTTPEYTYIVKDLIHPTGENYGMDPLSPEYEAHFAEFSLKDIEDAMGHSWTEWEENLKVGLPKAEADNVEDRFDYWATVCD